MPARNLKTLSPPAPERLARRIAPPLEAEQPPSERFDPPEAWPRIAGVDEAGRGPWAGPVVCAAVVLRTAKRLPVLIDDSKRLTHGQRARAFEVILRHAHVGFGIVAADEIDRRNILHATLLAMRQAVLDLPVVPALVLVDGASAPPVAMPCRAVVRGDARCYPISCASIMAKVLRDRLMTFYHRLYPAYAFHEHKGYGTAMHASNLKRFGPSFLHRLTFAPVRNALVTGPAAEHPTRPRRAALSASSAPGAWGPCSAPPVTLPT